MLKEQIDDPLSQFFQEGFEECVKYQKKENACSKSKSEKLREKIQKSNQIKREKRKQRRILQKKKLHEVLSPMTQQEKRAYLDRIKEEKEYKKQRVRQAMSHGQMFILDLTFESKMNSKENKSLASQIELIMKAIKYVEAPPSIHLCSFKDGIKEQLQKMRYEYWALTTHQEDVAAFTQGVQKRFIYLSPDAEETLDSIDQNDAFILGGLIDRTIIKNASFTRAKSLGIQAKRLPINQYMKGRACLNLDHVISMICKFKQTGSWKTAFYFAAPKRWKKEQNQLDASKGSQEQKVEIKGKHGSQEGDKQSEEVEHKESL